MLLLLAGLLVQAASPPPPAFEPQMAQEPEGEIEAVMISPLFRGPFVCGDHPAGLPTVVGDGLGTDCQILGREAGSTSFRRLYRDEGARNEDWYSWGAEVLAPFDGVVTLVLSNAVVNQPGARGVPPAGLVQVQRDDGVVVVYAHVADFAVAVGDRVRAGQVIARVGNNGPSYAPHVHAGAYRGAVPLQIRWDQRAMLRLAREGGGAPSGR